MSRSLIVAERLLLLLRFRLAVVACRMCVLCFALHRSIARIRAAFRFGRCSRVRVVVGCVSRLRCNCFLLPIAKPLSPVTVPSSLRRATGALMLRFWTTPGFVPRPGFVPLLILSLLRSLGLFRDRRPCFWARWPARRFRATRSRRASRFCCRSVRVSSSRLAVVFPVFWLWSSPCSFRLRFVRLAASLPVVCFCFCGRLFCVPALPDPVASSAPLLAHAS